MYLDSPVTTALRQISPYFDSGILDRDTCPVYMRKRALVCLQRILTQTPQNMQVRPISGPRVPEDPGTVLLYPFNAQSNMNAISFRQFHHVLTLHGESNKIASFRPAARLYDYVCVAGPLAIDRYLDNGIFTSEDVDRGRLIQMGDSFVQRLGWLRPTAADNQDGVLFYCPTWEGFGSQKANYSSIVNGVGFEHVARLAKAKGIERIVVKPHPYLGMLRPWMWLHFLKGIRSLRHQGFHVRLALGDLQGLRSISLQLNLARVQIHKEDDANPLPVRLAVTDVSGMEAVLLIAGVPTLVVEVLRQPVPQRIARIKQQKTLYKDGTALQVARAYLENATAIDRAHRAQLFSFHDPSLSRMINAKRMDWLTDYVHSDTFWNGAKPPERQY